MRHNILAAAAAVLVTFSLGLPAEAAPRRKPAAGAQVKKKAAADAAARRSAAARAAAEAAEQARLRPAWGLLADMGDLDFEVGGMPLTFRWDQPMRVLRSTLWTAKGAEQFLFTVDPATLKLSGRGALPGASAGGLGALAGLAGAKRTGTEAADRQVDFFLAPTGEIMWSALGKPERFMWREKDGSVRQRWSAGATRKIEPLRADGKAGITLAQLVASGEVRRQASHNARPTGMGAKLYTGQEAMAFFQGLAGPWSNGRMILTFRAGSNAVAYEFVHGNGNTGTAAISLAGGKLTIADEVAVFVPGGFLLPKSRYGYFPKPDGTFQVRMGRLKGGGFDDEKDRGYQIPGDWRRIDQAAVTAFRQQAEQTRLAALQAERQRQASGGGGGMFGKMLGGALMGAMLGGGGTNSIEMAMIGATKAAEGGNTLDQLNAMNDVQAQKTAESKRQLDATIARAEAQAAAQREAARIEAERVAAENQRRMAEAREQQQRMADAAAARQATGDAARAQQLADARAERERQAAAATAKAEADRVRAAAEADRQRREADAAAAAEKRRQAEAARLAEVQRKREEEARPVAFKEGMVLCQQRPNSTEWRCPGPLQVTYTKMDHPQTLNEIGMACGSRTGIREVGMVGPYRVFGCGFGIHPTARDYPGNNDVPAQLGVFIDNRRTFYCPRSKLAYCR
ncbi:hypothetical protein [Sphingomonas sp. LHG3406-1]|uniref:hypothetical protein n=1 Tax=Sphingomonas sp. LHG3406-1 TaxID=2804617 RepID=UPI00260E3FFE|nr:hypothetical protein [Sphingomonas sp. LHG3406-1]